MPSRTPTPPILAGAVPPSAELGHLTQDTISLTVDGAALEVPDDGSSLLEVLRQQVGVRSPKDGCSPQGQCGCCTVWIDGSPRVACVTPVRRVAGRSVITIDGLDPASRAAWAEAFVAHGASQCGFCTPGIIMRLAGLSPWPGPHVSADAVAGALRAHLCRCTGWRSILEAACSDPGSSSIPRDLVAAAHRAELEGRSPQQVGAHVAMGQGGFSDDGAPPGCLVALPDGAGGWVVAESLAQAREQMGKVQGRRSTVDLTWPLEVAPGTWALTLRTTWVEPAYLEPDASWCEPGGEPSSPLANGGAFGGKASSPVASAARELADRHGRAVRVLFDREDVVRMGPKRPPVAIGVDEDGRGVMRVLAPRPDIEWDGLRQRVAKVAPGLAVQFVTGSGPPVSPLIRGAGWVEAAAVLGALRATGPAVEVVSPEGARAVAQVDGEGIRVQVTCGRILDQVVLRSYCLGAAHMALGLVRSEGVALGPDQDPVDLTIRSWGILRAVDTPCIDVEFEDSSAEPVNGSDAVMAAVAGAVWIAEGLTGFWPTRQGAGEK